MPQAHKTSFLITLSLIFLLPLFFIPGGTLYIDSAKAALLIAGVVIASLIFALELWRDGKLGFPNHYFLAAVVALPLVYALSALLSTPTSLSLFGYGFEVGTFGFMLICSVLLLLCSVVFADTSRTLQALAAFFISAALIALFAAAKLFAGPDTLVWGNFSGNMGSPLGNWTDLAVVFGFLSVFSALTLGMIPMRLSAKALLYATFLLSTALLIIINFSVAFIFTLVASILLYFYFANIEKGLGSKGERGEMGKRGRFSGPTMLPIILGIISLIFVINPQISETRGNLGNVVANAFGIENTEVKPSFSATLDISKAVLSQGALLGSGPNTFSHDWLIYKPANVNATPFWSVAFPFGVGFVPTQIASTGILGTALWLFFFISLIILGVKALSRLPESRAERFTVISSLLGTLFLWAASFLYAPSATVLALAFVFSGLFIATISQSGVVSIRTIDLKKAPQNRFAAVAALAVLVLSVGALGWVGYGKTAAAYHFKKAVDLSNTPNTPLSAVGNELISAVDAAPADIHYIALSRLHFSIAQAAASATTSPEQNREVFQESISRSIEASRLAVSTNPAGYQNWVALGTVYSSLVPKPLEVEGAYENARFAFNEALKRNPNNPELYLLLAQLELNKGDADAARSLIRSSIALKEDYANAYLMLAELELAAGNTAEAIASAENLAILVPNNPGLHFELGLLKYGSKNFAGAEKDLNQALVLSPEYANARYYLGLTLAELGRFSEAQAEFEILERANPENAEIQSALTAVRQGKKPVLQTSN